MDLEKEWESIKQDVSKTWSKLTHEDIEKIKGKKDALIDLLKAKYEWTKIEASEKVDEFYKKLKK